MKNNTIRWINKSVGKLNRYWALLIITSVVQSAIVVAFALSVKELVNSAFESNPTMKIVLQKTAITAILVVLSFAFGAMNKIFTEKCKIFAEVAIKNRTFKSVLKKDYKLISEYHSGDIVSRLSNDSQIVARGYATVLPTLVSMLSKVVFSVGALLFIQPLFTVILLLFGVISVVSSFLFRKRFKKLYKDTRAADSEVVSYFNENANNLLAVKVFSAEDKTANKSEIFVGKYKKCAEKQRYASALLSSTMSFVFTSFYVVTLVWGLVGVVNNLESVNFGVITSMIQLVSQLQAPFANATALISVYYEMLASAERIIELENLQEDVFLNDQDLVEKEQNFTSIRAKDLSFSYDRDNVLTKIDFQIDSGDFVMLKGESGIGKSTLLKLLLGVYAEFEGQLVVNYKDKVVPIDGNTRKLFAYVPQGNLLFSGTVKENLCFLSGIVSDEEIRKVMKIACLDFIDDLPNGLDTVLGERGAKLSEGQCQRVAIGRAILGNRPILLLDEATNSLDDKTQKKMLENLKELKRERKTVIMVSHKISESSDFDKCYTLVCGKLIKS